MPDALYERLAAGELPSHDEIGEAIDAAKTPMEGLVLLCARIASVLKEQQEHLSTLDDVVDDMKTQAQLDRALLVHIAERLDALSGATTDEYPSV